MADFECVVRSVFSPRNKVAYIKALAVSGVVVTSVIALTGLPLKAQDLQKSPSQTVSVPVDDGQITSALERLDELSRNVFERSGVPGLAVAVTWRGKTVFARGYGVRKVGEPEPVDADTVFQIASVSKSLAGTVVAAKVGEGIVRWDDPVIKYLPRFSLMDPAVTRMVTIGDLFAHRSGLPDHAGDDLEDLGFNRDEVLERLHLLPLGAFRDDYAYTNFGLTAAAEAVAAASGADWASLSEEVLYGPLGMSRTSSRFDDYIGRENRAYPHVRDNGSFESLYQREPDAQSPAGGASSTVRDLAAWMALILDEGSYQGDQLIDADALRMATTGQVISAPAHAIDARSGLYGFGFNVGVEPSGRVTLSHSGAFSLGAATSFLMVPSLDLGIVVLTNAEPFGVPEGLARSFVDMVEYGEPTRDWLAGFKNLFAPITNPAGSVAGEPVPAEKAPARKLEDYTGTYSNAYFGPVTVDRQAEKLSLVIGPSKQTYVLSHWDANSFFFDLRLENAPAGSRSLVRFDEGEGGEVDAMWIEFLDENGLGTFEKQ